jgi:uncharacterized protein YlzI (FlbEa/FlbD family)
MNRIRFIELTGIGGEEYHVNIALIENLHTCGNGETVINMSSQNSYIVKESANAITKQIHFILNDAWSDVKRQVITDLIGKYGFEEGNRRYIEGEEKEFMENMVPVCDRQTNKSEDS